MLTDVHVLMRSYGEDVHWLNRVLVSVMQVQLIVILSYLNVKAELSAY